MQILNRPARWIVFLAALMAGCAGTVTQSRLKIEVEVLDALTRYEATYVLQPGDVIEVFVYRHAEMSRKAVIRPDGFISLPLLGDVKASGKAPQELAKEVSALYSVRMINPEVTVIVENPQEPAVYVLGEVGGPRSLPLRQAKTAAQAIALSGNTTKAGDLFSISIVRLNREGQLEAHTVKASGYNQPEIYMALQNMRLMPNDLVVVPESSRAQIVRILTDVNVILSPYYQLRVLQSITN